MGSGRGGHDSRIILNNIEQSTHKPIQRMKARPESLRLPVLGEQEHGPSSLVSVSGWMNANTTPSIRQQASLVGSPPLAAGLGAWLGAWLGARCDGDLLGECQLSCHGPAGQQPNDHQAQGRGPSYILSTNTMKYRGCESCLISFGLSLPV